MHNTYSEETMNILEEFLDALDKLELTKCEINDPGRGVVFDTDMFYKHLDCLIRIEGEYS